MNDLQKNIYQLRFIQAGANDFSIRKTKGKLFIEDLWISNHYSKRTEVPSLDTICIEIHNLARVEHLEPDHTLTIKGRFAGTCKRFKCIYAKGNLKFKKIYNN